MAYVHIRIEDDFYKEIQSVLRSKLKTDISSFVRDVLQDTLIIYGDTSRTTALLTKMGRKHQAQGWPSLIFDMGRDWFKYHAPNFKRLQEHVQKLIDESGMGLK